MKAATPALLAGVLALGATFAAALETLVPPTGEVMLTRAAAQALPLADVAAAISAAPDLPAAQTALERLKLALPGEIRLNAPGGAAALRESIQTLWGEAAPHIKEDFQWDESWAVPAVVVSHPGRTYYIHPRAHGFYYGLGGEASRRLADQVERAGAPLLIEQNLPQAYGLRYGREVVSSADERFAGGRVMSSLEGLLGRSFHRLYFKGLSVLAQWRGQSDYAKFLGRVGRAMYGTPQSDWREVRALELPMPLKASLEWAVARRSRDLAREAKAAGAQDVHILTGWSHVFDLAWLLSPRS